MNTHEEIAQWVIDNRYPKNENDKVSDLEMYTTIKNAMQTAVDQALAWIPVDANNLLKGEVICRDAHGILHIGFMRFYNGKIYCETDVGLVVEPSFYFDPANLKFK